MRPRRSSLPIALVLSGLALATAAAHSADLSLVGELVIEWGDPDPESGGKSHRRVLLALDHGPTVELAMSDALLRGGVTRWIGRRVRVFLRQDEAGWAGLKSLPVAAIRLEDPRAATKDVTGSQPWVSILCKFSDKPAEQEDVAFFSNMYGVSAGRLDHYWREVSSEVIDLVGSTAVDWVTLPGTQASYIPTPGSGSLSSAELSVLFDDCTAAATPFVDFTNGGSAFVGINMIFNDVLDCCAWGGSRWATLDGLTKSWRVTWMPTWAWDDLAVFGHEMGHGFGFPHSTNWDDDGNPYDSPWDVMSSANTYSPNDPTYGERGKHTITYHKDLAGWIPAGQKLTLDASPMTITLDRTGKNDSANTRMAILPIGEGSTYYVVEARLRGGEYESALPGDGVLIFHIDPSREEPAWLYDESEPPAGFADNEGSLWRVGETFNDATNGISVSVDSMTAEGFVVTLTPSGAGLIFSDGFESGDTSAW